jgi:hypothetical protein
MLSAKRGDPLLLGPPTTMYAGNPASSETAHLVIGHAGDKGLLACVAWGAIGSRLGVGAIEASKTGPCPAQELSLMAAPLFLAHRTRRKAKAGVPIC